MKYDIVTIGDAFEDVFVEPDLKVQCDRNLAGGKGISFEFGEKIPLQSVTYEIGGSACNTAVGFSRLGLKTGIVSVLGDDSPKEKVLARLDKEGVDSTSINIKKDIQSGFSVIFTMDGERTIFVYHGLKDYSELKIKKNLKSNWFYISPLGENIDGIEKRMLAEISENNTKLAWNPGSIQIAKGTNCFRPLLRCTSVLSLNKEEAIKFLNHPFVLKIEDIMKRLQNIGPSLVVVTEGREGARAYDGKQFYRIKAKEVVNKVDSTGAGDAFAVGFLARLMKLDWKNRIQPEEIEQALKWGIENSSSVLRYIGAQKGLLSNLA